MSNRQWSAMQEDITTSEGQWRRKTSARIANGTLSPDPRVEFLNYIGQHIPKGIKSEPRQRQ